MASLMDWMENTYEESHGNVYAQLTREMRHSVSDKAYQVLFWDADVCTLGEDSLTIEEALNDACKWVKPYFTVEVDFPGNIVETWKFYQFATTWVVRIEREKAPVVMAVLVSKEFGELTVEGYLV